MAHNKRIKGVCAALAALVLAAGIPAMTGNTWADKNRPEEEESSGAAWEEESSGALPEEESPDAGLKEESSGSADEKESTDSASEEENFAGTDEDESFESTPEEETQESSSEEEETDGESREETTEELTTEPEIDPHTLTLNDHNYLTENSRYRLYLRESDLSLVVEDKETGAWLESAPSYDDAQANNTWWEAMNSAVVITIINNNNDTQQAGLLYGDIDRTITYTEKGFSAELYWQQYKFGLTLEVSFDDDGLVVRVPEESIKEDSEQYYIGTVSLYPYMGISYLDTKEGYLLIPDGNGALVYLNDKEGAYKSGYSGVIYGKDTGFDDLTVSTLLWDRYEMISDAEQTLAPIFGLAHTDDQIAFLGIVEEGDERASIEVAPNGVAVDYNRIFAKFVLRRLYTQPTSNNSTAGSLHIYESDRSHSDLQIRFKFLSGEEANYAGMAGTYREYLLEKGELVPQDTAYRSRVDFLGTERESWVVGTASVVMTTVSDIRSILRDLNEAGVKNLFSVYKGWQKGGMYDLPIEDYKADGGIGGTDALTKLIGDAPEYGTQLYLYNNALIINPDENNATFNVVKKVNKRRFEMPTYKDVYDTLLYLTPQRSAYLLEKFVKSYTTSGKEKLCIAGITNSLFTYTYSGNKYTRFDTADVYSDVIHRMAIRTDVVLEQPSAYLWKDTKAFLDMPLYTSSYILEDESIPFMSIVLKGVLPVYSEYVNFEANKQEFFLKMIESGTYPSYYITQAESSELIYTNSNDIYSSQYNVYRDTIIAYDKELSAFNAKVEGAYITAHDILENKVVRVKYSNGVTVYLNYSEKEQQTDGVTIASMSYEVLDQ